MGNQEKRRDDLTQIKGIGAVRQRWLAKTFGVLTFADLAALSANTIANQIKSEGKVLARKEIESWLDQAGRLAEPVAEGVAVQDVRVRSGLSKKKEAVWKPAASFVVEFQTRLVNGRIVERRTAVQHMEADVSESWPDIAQEPLCAWMTKQVNSPQTVDEPAPRAAVIDAKPLKLTATQVLLSASDQVTRIDSLEAKRPFLGHIDGDQPIHLEITFEQTNGQTVQPQKINAQCRLQNRLNRKPAQLLDMEAVPTSGKKLSYNTSLTDALLEPGIYDLGILVSGQPPMNASYFELPKLNVL